MRLLVCGGRDFGGYQVLQEAILSYKPSVVIHGAARGADGIAGRVAIAAGIPVEAYRADWDTYGKRAGAIRNRQMLKDSKPDLVLAAPGGRGTEDMIQVAKRAGVPVVSL